MDSKALGGVEIKNAAKGEVEALFSTLNVVDKDGDVTLDGAFEDGAPVKISSYGHAVWGGAPPVGKGVIRAIPGGAVLKGQFFMDTTAGRDTFNIVKQLADEQEWSYGFDVLDFEHGEHDGQRVRFLKRLKVHEVSPVFMGAGVGTRTLAVKSTNDTKGSGPVEYKRAIRPHTSAATTREWDEAAVVAGIGDDTPVSELRTIYAWADGDPEQKSSYRFAHHHGVDGPANIRACITGIAVLNGVKGAPIPEEDRQAVYDHLAQHLREADREPPELRPIGSGQKKLHEEAFEALAGVTDYLESARRVAALRAQHGKSLSQVNLEALEWVGEDLERVLIEHKSLMRQIRNAPNEAAAEEYVRLLAMQWRANNHV